MAFDCIQMAQRKESFPFLFDFDLENAKRDKNNKKNFTVKYLPPYVERELVPFCRPRREVAGPKFERWRPFHLQIDAPRS